ncbi:MAG: hypothetical protein KA369_05685 [Spirochaetes bacterium]|nr:hypothetical protein [Spirochaetota bacterium]
MSILNGKVILFHNERHVIVIKHSLNSFEEKVLNIEMADIDKALREGIDIILDVFKDSKGHFIIISKSKKFGIQLDWRRDTFNTEDRRNHGYTATTLDSETQKEVYRHDTKIFVEDFEKHGIAQWFETTDIDKMIEQTGYYAIEISECPGYKRYIKEGKLYANFEIIEVE